MLNKEKIKMNFRINDKKSEELFDHIVRSIAEIERKMGICRFKRYVLRAKGNG